MNALLEQARAVKTVQAKATAYPEPVSGRVAHIDADFIAYQVSAESKKELDPNDPTPRKSLEDMYHNARVAVEHTRKLAGAETYVCHTTPSGSTKGGRYDIAIQAEYQANRKNSTKPQFLDEIRRFIGQELNGIPHLDQEADDGLTQAAYNDPDNTIICSLDKDLRMIAGWHLDMNTGVIDHVDSFGYIELDRSKSAPKVTGYGTKFFWAQCLMGDIADNIKGLPLVHSTQILGIDPPKAYTALMEKEELTEAQLKKLDAYYEKHKKCGAVLAHKLLADASTDAECFHIVKTLWMMSEDAGHTYRHWETGEETTWNKALVADMKLLWMRRTKDADDVIKWMKETLT